MWKKTLCVFLAVLMFGGSALAAPAAPGVSAPSAILMEKETGNILFEKDADTPRPPASVTKIMTVLLVMEAIDKGTLRLDETVTISRNAQDMGGSQVYLAEGEQYTVHELLKAVVVASGNDAAVALAEHMSGSEETFVGRMNEKAAELGMTNTFFRDCTGLYTEGHYTTARDIAVMSRALLRYPGIRDYTTIWMDTLRGGTFGLNNTNRLIRYYPGATGLKTGSTSIAKYCLSGTAERDGMELIAVILAADTSDNRFNDARALLDFGFANYTLIAAYPDEVPRPVPVILGKTSAVQPQITGDTRVLVEKAQLSQITRQLVMVEDVHAPVEEGQKLGELILTCGDEVLANVPIVAAEAVERLSLFDIFRRIAAEFFVSSV